MRLSARNPMRSVLLSVLIFEVIVFALAVPVMIFVSGVPTRNAVLVAGGAALLALVSSATLRKPWGYVLGWVTQAAALSLGLLTSTMFIVGAMFAGLWLITVVLGRRLDERNAARAE
ncbi:MAG: hypothetical protein JWP61_2207 [Friedmanniella sp.]|nr:hypothetical protein [Friedmanniella sp.]